ncbi:MAG: efflux RND transporter periplasmic adaptor subunit [Betaproteobacteria bacterium]
MKTAKLVVLALVVVGFIASGYGAYRAGMNRGMQMGASASDGATSAAGVAQKVGDIEPTTGKRVLYWHDPMVPGQKFDKPGKSPFMDMQLVPVYAGDSDDGKITISSRVQQNLGMRTAEVVKGALAPAVEAVGNVVYNERDVVVVQARTNGYIEKLYVRAPLDPVKQSQPLAEIYAPDWVAAQEEYLSLKRMSGAGLDQLTDGARQRMRLAGMTEDHIRLVEQTSKVQPRLIVTAPMGGVIAELGAREGMTVMSGAPLFRINGLSTVWVNAEVPEMQASLLRPGNPVEARTPALPGSVFKGRVSAILPEVNAATRTLKARVELRNPGARLVPGMFATVNFAPTARKEILLVPSEAVINTGRRSVVIVAYDEGRFAAVNVDAGMESNGKTEIRKGLQAGQKVVVSGQFLIDSEASLKAATTRMGERATPDAAKTGGAAHRGTGKVTDVDPAKGRVELEHGPIPTMKWPPMKMGFAIADKKELARLKKGDAVEFELSSEPNQDGDYVIEKIAPAGSKP